MFIPQMSQRVSVSLPPCSTTTVKQKCLYKKFYRIRPALRSISGHPGTGPSTYFKIMGKDTKYVVDPPPPTSTPRVCGRITPCDLSMCCLIYESATYAPQSEQITLVHFLSRNIPPSPVSLLLYAFSLIWPHMYPGVQTITFLFPSCSPARHC